MYWNWSSKVPDLSYLGPIWPNLDAIFEIPARKWSDASLNVKARLAVIKLIQTSCICNWMLFSSLSLWYFQQRRVRSSSELAMWNKAILKQNRTMRRDIDMPTHTTLHIRIRINTYIWMVKINKTYQITKKQEKNSLLNTSLKL